MEEFIERLTRNLLNALDLKKLTKDDLSNLKKGDEFYHTDKFESNELHKCKIVSVSKSKIRYEVGNGDKGWIIRLLPSLKHFKMLFNIILLIR